MSDIISRAEWQAAPARSAGNAISASPKGVAVHYEGPKMGRREHSKCAALVRSIQRFHQETRGWADVAYNFLVCEHGHVYEGRGTGKGSAANGTAAANAAYYAVCGLVGQGDPVSDALLAGIRDVIDHLRAHGAGAAVVGHRDLFATACPGEPIYEWVKKGAPRPGGAPAPKPPASAIPAIKKPAPAKPAVPAFPGTTRRGSRGNAVVKVQARLKARGWRVGVDGDFGPATERVVIAFQREKRLTPDGVVGPKTWAALWTAAVTP